MKVRSLFLLLVTVAFLEGGSSASAAEPVPATGTNTLWHWLGIPQGYNKIRDARVNKNGNRPDKERTPPLKRIADPANLESQNPAIKTAAKIKSEEDLAPQKVKAIKYLGTVGCGCYPGVREALLAALDDCTEEVRYEAALALCQVAGNPCQKCDKSGCCNAEVMNKLNDMATGQDADGCCKEASARVRAAAANALNACRNKNPSAPLQPIPDRKELPTEAPTPAVKELPREPEAPQEPKSAPLPPSSNRRSIPQDNLFHRTSMTKDEGFAEAQDTYIPSTAISRGTAIPADTTNSQEVAEQVAFLRRGRRCPPTPSVPVCPHHAEVKPSEPAVPGGETTPSPAGEQDLGKSVTEEPAGPPLTAVASNYGAPSGPLSSAPNMIGDAFGSGTGTSRIVRSFSYSGLAAVSPISSNFYTVNDAGQRVALNQGMNGYYGPTFPLLDYNDASGRLGGPPLPDVPAGGTLVGGLTTSPNSESFTSQFDVAYDVLVPSPSGDGGAVGRMKIADDTSPMPRDRLIFDYSYFDGVPLFPGGVNVNRFTPGFEKTFLNQWMSIEVKLPMATTLDSTIVQGGVTNTSHGEFGNVLLTWKTLLLRHETWALSGGLRVAPPTADDVNVVYPDGTPLVQVRNRSTHLGPFLGFLWTPNDRWYAQGFLQYDVGANGNPVLVNNNGNSLLTEIGTLDDTPFQYADIGVGYWAYKGHERFNRITGIAFTTELHWNRSLQDADVLTAGNWRIGDYATSIENFNLTLGTHVELYDLTTITAGYSVPLGGGDDRQFNGEFRLMFNRRFGSQNRLTQATF